MKSKRFFLEQIFVFFKLLCILITKIPLIVKNY